MKKINKQAITIVEAMVVLLILTLGLVGVYSIYSNSIKMVNNLGNKIQAIQIAREGVEAMMNIRDTNWMLFPLNKEYCWMTFNYDGNCITETSLILTNKINSGTGSYKVYKNEAGRWKLERPLSALGNYGDENCDTNCATNYRDFYKVSLDDKGLYTQTGGVQDTLPLFTREIKIEPVPAFGGDTTPPFNNAVKIESIVKWVDSVRASPQEVKLELVIMNYAK